MSKDKLKLLSPLFLKYQSDFEKNPRSKVFAPLAEMYRKIGMVDKSMEILAQGIRYNPAYVMGYLGIAFCYFDLKQYNLAYTTLRPLVETNRDNIRLQRLFADICTELAKKDEALETFKYLLFINPKDRVVADLVFKLEKEIEDRYQPQHKPIIIPHGELTSEEKENRDHLFDVDKLKNDTKNDLDNWMTIDLNPKAESKIEPELAKKSADDEFDFWSVKKTGKIDVRHLDELPEAPIIESERSFHVHLDREEPSETVVHAPVEEAPLVTHTLVDLYIGQGHIEKAVEVLEKILQLNPYDQRTIKKLIEIKELMAPIEQINQELDAEIEQGSQDHLVAINEVENITEEEGRSILMNLIDQKLGPVPVDDLEEAHQEQHNQLVEKKLNLFLKKIQQRALEYQSRV